jgi:hypothetical protein
MRELLIKVSLVLFGVEHAILLSVSEEEKNKFLKLSFLFLTIAASCVISSVYLFFLISSSFWFAFLIGPLLGLIFLSIIRFSILTIQRSLYETKVPDIAIEIAEPLTNRNKISSVLKKVRFPGIELLMRILINGIMGCLIIFPLVSLLHFQSLESLNQQKRDSILNEFIISKNKSFSIENNHFIAKIKQLEKSLSSITNLESQGGVYKTKQNELIKIKAEQNQYKESFASDLEKQSERLKEYLSSKYFIIFTLSKAVFYPEFIFVAIAIFGLLFYLHYLQHTLKTNESYQYAKLAKEKYVSIVMNDYNQTKLHIEKTLKKKFSNHKIDISEMSRWKNPPFNTEEKTTIPNRKSILKSELIESLTTK